MSSSAASPQMIPPSPKCVKSQEVWHFLFFFLNTHRTAAKQHYTNTGVAGAEMMVKNE